MGIIYRVNGQKRTLEEMRGVRPCYEPDKDIVVPSWKWSWRFPNSIYLEKADGDAAKGMEMELADLTGRNRTLLFAFAGDFGGQWGRSERWYSQGIRFSLYTRFGNARAKDFPEVALKAGHIIGQDGYNVRGVHGHLHADSMRNPRHLPCCVLHRSMLRTRTVRAYRAGARGAAPGTEH